MVFQSILFIAYKINKTLLHVCATCFFRSFYITTVLKFLHRLPFKYRIDFELCCITYRALSLGKPHYLNSKLIHILKSPSFLSSSFNPLMLPFFGKMSNGFHSFA